MKAYKATYNMKCETITYEVGRSYEFIGEIKICQQGFHFCFDAQDTLTYYPYNKEFILLEIEVDNNNFITIDNHKAVTDKFKVTRVVNKSEYPTLLKIELDNNDNLIRNDNVFGNSWTYKYDEHNNLIEKTSPYDYIYPIGNKWTYKYDKNNNKIKKTDSFNQILTQWKYDDNNNLIEKIENKKKTWKYDKNYKLIEKKENTKHIWKYDYDKNNNLIKETDPAGCIQEWEYDDKGHKVKQTDWLKRVTTWKYDENDDLIQHVQCVGNTSKYLIFNQYDKNHNIIKTNVNGDIWKYKYDDNNNLIEQINPEDTWKIIIT
jgi:YD repeat-containing protein